MGSCGCTTRCSATVRPRARHDLDGPARGRRPGSVRSRTPAARPRSPDHPKGAPDATDPRHRNGHALAAGPAGSGERLPRRGRPHRFGWALRPPPTGAPPRGTRALRARPHARPPRSPRVQPVGLPEVRRPAPLRRGRPRRGRVRRPAQPDGSIGIADDPAPQPDGRPGSPGCGHAGRWRRDRRADGHRGARPHAGPPGVLGGTDPRADPRRRAVPHAAAHPADGPDGAVSLRHL